MDPLNSHHTFQNLIRPLADIHFENGVDFSYNPGAKDLNYRAHVMPRGFRFQGSIQFLGLHSHTVIDFGPKERD